MDSFKEPVPAGLPKNKKGTVDEWLAVEQQKQRAIEALNLQQKEEEKAAKKVYGYLLFPLTVTGSILLICTDSRILKRSKNS